MGLGDAVRCWTGAEAKVLRRAIRLSIRAFAEYLDVSVRTVDKWEARGASITPLPDTQGLLDTALVRASDEVKARFAEMRQDTPGTGESPDVQLSAVPPQSDVGTLEASSEALLPDQLVSLLAALFRRKESGQSAAQGGARDEVMSFLRRWVGTMDRRELLHLFGWVATTVAGSTVLGSLNTDEQERVAKAVSYQNRVDEQVIAHIDDILWAAKENDDRLGPQAALSTVLAQRQLVQTMLPGCPDRLRPQLLSVLSNASRSAGWMYLNSDDLGNARSFYEEARVAAHEAENTELAAYGLCFMSGLSAQFGPELAKVRVDIDHAVAAESWAHKTGNVRLQAFAATIVSRAYSVAGDNAECMRGLERAQSYLASFNGSRTRVPGNFDEAGLMSHRGQCLLRLGQHREAASALSESLSGLDPSYVRVTALTKIDLAKANIQAHNIDGAAGVVGEAAELATTNRSPRLLKRLRDVRADLAPWQDARAVRELDTRLSSYRLV